MIHLHEVADLHLWLNVTFRLEQRNVCMKISELYETQIKFASVEQL